MATFYGADGLIVDVQPKDPKKGFTMNEVCDLLESDAIQLLRMNDDAGMYIDPEAKLAGLPVNDNATKTWYGSVDSDRVIYGDAILVKRKKWQP